MTTTSKHRGLCTIGEIKNDIASRQHTITPITIYALIVMTCRCSVIHHLWLLGCRTETYHQGSYFNNTISVGRPSLGIVITRWPVRRFARNNQRS